MTHRYSDGLTDEQLDQLGEYSLQIFRQREREDEACLKLKEKNSVMKSAFPETQRIPDFEV